MQSTSHTPMRTSTVRTELGCIRRDRPGCGTERRAAIAESAGRPR